MCWYNMSGQLSIKLLCLFRWIIKCGLWSDEHFSFRINFSFPLFNISFLIDQKIFSLLIFRYERICEHHFLRISSDSFYSMGIKEIFVWKIEMSVCVWKVENWLVKRGMVKWICLNEVLFFFNPDKILSWWKKNLFECLKGNVVYSKKYWQTVEKRNDRLLCSFSMFWKEKRRRRKSVAIVFCSFDFSNNKQRFVFFKIRIMKRTVLLVTLLVWRKKKHVKWECR